MPQHKLHFEERIQAPVETVFDFLAEHQNFAALFGGHCTRIRVGTDPAEANGIGSVRRIGPGPLSFDEEIVAFERPARIDYTIIRGGPLKNHLGSIRLTPTADGGTALDYVIRFDGRLPGLGYASGQALSLAWKRSARKTLATLER
ncbi:SRPBCC family protein [Solimonas marina]|uniref:SRPBCC family protein n=1 Tax=Solimonas marina TaxID=2714601 RepID=A0A969WAI3_9GAMM|nr:SRPBCC family protein [Solimonas marina]NKF22919.1 SRPBCC family protein [Solimonas marina]